MFFGQGGLRMLFQQVSWMKIKNHRINCDAQSFLLSLRTTWLEKLVSSKTPMRTGYFWLNHFSVNFNMYKQTHSFVTP